MLVQLFANFTLNKNIVLVPLLKQCIIPTVGNLKLNADGTSIGAEAAVLKYYLINLAGEAQKEGDAKTAGEPGRGMAPCIDGSESQQLRAEDDPNFYYLFVLDGKDSP